MESEYTIHMTHPQLSRGENWLFRILGYGVLIAAVAIGFDRAPSVAVRWTSVGLSVVFGLVMLTIPTRAAPRWAAHLYLGVQCALGTVVLFIHPDWTAFTLLFIVLSAQAMLLLPMRQGVIWIGVLVVITVVVGFYWWGLPGAGLALALYSGAYAFFGIFAHAFTRADAARRESQQLLAELQEAHRQLQEYALHAEEMAVVQERNRLAREMHDTLGHRLTVAAVQLEGAQRLCSTDPGRAQDMVGTVREEVREALGELRSAVATLRAPIEADLQLRSSLRRLITHFEEATGRIVHQVLPEEMPELPGVYRLAIYRAAQEALTNVQKHARATQVWLMLTAQEDAVTLLVGDDGQGVSLSGEQSGFGLRGMRERAAQLGGELHLEPRRGGGTQVSFRLPLPAREGSSDG
jgi:signal transduction histidine kinase